MYCFNLLNIPIPRFSFTWTWASCLLHCRCSSRRIPRYLTVLIGVINSVFLTFNEKLLAFNYCDKLLRFWLNFLAKISHNLPDCRIFVLSAKWYALKYSRYLCRDLLLFYGEHFYGFFESDIKIIVDIQIEFTRTVCISILSVNCKTLLLFPKMFLVLRIAKL